MDEKQLKELQTALKASEETLKVTLKTQNEEMRKHGETTAETVKAVEAAEARLDQAVADLQGSTQKSVEALQEELKDAKGRLEELEKKGQRPGWPSDGPEEKSLSQRFLESKQLKSARDRGEQKTSPVVVGSFFPTLEEKAALMSTAATRLVMPQRADFVAPALRRLRIRDLIPVSPTTSNAIEFHEETGFAATGSASGTQTHGAAAPVAEGAAAPEAQLELELRTNGVKDIKHFLPASRQILDDDAQMRAYIDVRMTYGVAYEEETQLLYGDGSGPNLQGLMTHSSRQTYAWSAGTVGDTKIDALRRAATKSHIREYVPTGMVVNVSDWEDIQLLKGTDNHYIWLSVASGTEEQLFRMPVVVTNAMVQGDALVGSFGMGAAIWDRQQAQIRISESHEDYFKKGLIGILGEERIALTTYRPDAFVDVDFDAAPS